MARNTLPAMQSGSGTPARSGLRSALRSRPPAQSGLAGEQARRGFVVCDAQGMDGALLRRATTLVIEPEVSFLSFCRTESATVSGVTTRPIDNTRSHPNAGAIALIDEWLAADWEEDTGELEELQRGLDENRSSACRTPPPVGYPGAVALLRSWTREDRARDSEDLDELKRNLDAGRPATEKLFP